MAVDKREEIVNSFYTALIPHPREYDLPVATIIFDLSPCHAAQQISEWL